ncbi:hypothetical protein AZI87_06820 [Bdellovibrio bacteriovorus]|uniref:IrrE N-terminal-like domain-containing protein n=1 Tax=Bdellovibrio bacteriovorus TaxID=959 RepID=A0A161PQM0_BDEBC|nr:hypothetical protein [Bdellovibrio bacteriovorus]KYG68933.1 hypothetical protein AZI87_06820 [Bdellovibrio bacteriovorus]
MKPLLLAIVLSSIGAFCADPAFAQKCSSIFSSQYALDGKVEVDARALHSTKTADEYAQTITEINSLIAPLEIPQQVKVSVGMAFKFSHFNAGDFSVYIGIRPDSMGKMHPKVNQTTMAHEYGHAIFEHNLIKDLESYKSLRHKAIHLEAQVEAAARESKNLVYRSDVTFDKKKKQELQWQAIEKMLESKSLKKEFKAFQRYWIIRTAFHELFADAVALTYTRDPKSIAKLLKSKEETNKEFSSNEIILRDFTDGRHHRNEQTWKKEHPFYTEFAADVYYSFLPARWELWNIAKNKIDSENYRKELPYKVFSILERNLSESLALSPETVGPTGLKDIQRMNDQIIEDFRREL